MKIERIKQYFVDLKKLMWPFKWYIATYLFVLSCPFHEYFFPPEADDPIFGQGVGQPWNYANQELYIESVKLMLIADVLVLLIGTSNMRNHPRIAKLIFLSPWLFGVMHLLLVLLGIESD